jgi:hypothetical protein
LRDAVRRHGGTKRNELGKNLVHER